MSKASFTDRVRYASDNAFSKGTIVLIGWRAAITVAVIVIIVFVVRVTGTAPDYSLPQLVWMGLMRTLDSGTMGGDEGSWPFLLAMLAVTLAGIFVLSTLNRAWLLAQDSGRGGACYLYCRMNPNKAAEIVFADGDSVVIFAEE